jgi:antitoxin ParD1/3/4
MTQVTVSMPPALQSWIEDRLADGDYADVAEYLRDLVRRDRAEAVTDRSWLRAMIAEGLASGVEERDAFEVLDEVIAEDPDLRG